MTISSFNAQPYNQSPDAYAQIYATQNNISLSEAKEELKEKYGDPSQDSIMSFGNSSTSYSDSFNFSGSTTPPLNSIDSGVEDKSSNSFLKNLFGIFRGNKANDNSETGQGPRMQGDFNPTNENPFSLGEGPRMQGDFNPTNENPFGSGEGPTKQGDFNPTNENPLETGQNPDAYAQMYADMKGISLDEAKAELKELYGDPIQE